MITNLMTAQEREVAGNRLDLVPKEARDACLNELRNRARDWNELTAGSTWPAQASAPAHWKEGQANLEDFSVWAGELLNSEASFVAAETHNLPGALVFLASNAARVAQRHPTVFTEFVPIELQASVDRFVGTGTVDLELQVYIQLSGLELRPLMEAARNHNITLVGIESFRAKMMGIQGATGAERSAAMNDIAFAVMNAHGVSPGATGIVVHCGVCHALRDQEDVLAPPVVGLGDYFGMTSIFFQPMKVADSKTSEALFKGQLVARQAAEKPKGTSDNAAAEYHFSKDLMAIDHQPGDEPKRWEAAYDFRVFSTNNLWQIDSPQLPTAQPVTSTTTVTSTVQQIPPGPAHDEIASPPDEALAPPPSDDETTPRPSDEEKSPEPSPRAAGSGTDSDSSWDHLETNLDNNSRLDSEDG
ncbi:MAG: hypothetical protein ABIR26_01425 [Ramlibacter sp.]